jgi:hypothetical protein
MITIGFAGTAKNTGKTTAALYMLDAVIESGRVLALTSIGFDGENVDHITGLPKPRYICQPGTLVATAEACLNYGDAVYTDKNPTGIRTLLGEIFVARVKKPGSVVLAGPNRRVDILPLLDILRETGCEVVFLDGALNRLAAMSMADGIVLSTGAAFDERVGTIASHAAAMESLFRRPGSSPGMDGQISGVTFQLPSGHKMGITAGSVMVEAAMKQVGGWLCGADGGRLVIPGIFEPGLFADMLRECAHCLSGKEFVFFSPLHILATGKPEVWKSNFHQLSRAGAAVNYMRPVPLCFITVNPFYPRYLQQTARYVPEYIDKVKLLRSVREAIPGTLVVDILQPPLPDLLSKIKLPEKKEMI